MGKKKVGHTVPVTPEPKVEKPRVLVRCPGCPWRAGLKDDGHYCDTCLGSGQVEAQPLE